MVNIMKKDVIS